jgi:hypothetical protein
VLSKAANNTNTTYSLLSVNSFTAPIAIKTRTKVGSDWSNEDGWSNVVAFESAWATNGFLAGHYKYVGSAVDYYSLLKFPGGTSNTTNESVTADTWYDYELRIIAADQKFLVNGVQKGALTITPIPVNPQKVSLACSREASSSNYTSYFDWVFVRSLLATEPAWGSWGVEEVEEIYDIAGVADSADAFSLTDSISDAAGIGDSADAYNTDSPIADSFGASDSTDAFSERPASGSDVAGIGDAADAGREAEGGFTDISGFGDSSDGFNYTAWAAANRDRAVIRYYCTLTGAADGLSDLTIPISSFQASKRTGESTYLSVVVPGMTYAEQIADRSNGELVIYMAYLLDGVESLREEILRVELEQINPQEGARSRSITLIGHKTVTYDSRAVSIQGCNYKYTSGGSRGFRFPQADPYLNPGDALTVIDTDDALTVDYITYAISARGAKFMEVREG